MSLDIKKRLRGYSLKTLTLLFLIPCMLLVLLSYLIFYDLGAEQLSKQTHKNAGNIVNQLSQTLGQSLEAAYASASAQLSAWNFFSMRQNIETDQMPITPSGYYSLHTNLTDFVKNSGDLCSMALYLNDSSIFVYYNEHQMVVSSINFDYAELNKTVSNRELTWVIPKEIHPYETGYEGHTSLGLMTLLGTDTSKRQGFILFEIDDALLRQSVENALITPNSMFFVVQDGSLLFHSDKMESQERNEIEKKLENCTDETEFQSNRFYCFYKPLTLEEPGCELGILAAVPVEEMLLDQKILTSALLGIILVFLLLCAGVYGSLSLVISKPLTRLEEKLTQVSENHLDVVFDVEGSREIDRINRAVTGLMERIRTLISNLDQEMDSRRIAELNILHEQINPHFLYNTLDTIYQLCSIGEIREAQAMTSQLATFYRIGVSKGGNDISLEEEFTHTRMYLSILQTRFDDFDYVLVLPEELKNYRTLKTVLQPLAENAIYHGIRPMRKGGLICIEAKREKADILIRVSDNGAGIPENRLTELREALEQRPVRQAPGKVYGLLNVHARIRMTYKEDYGLTIESRPERGTVVCLRIPAREQKMTADQTGRSAIENIVCR